MNVNFGLFPPIAAPVDAGRPQIRPRLGQEPGAQRRAQRPRARRSRALDRRRTAGRRGGIDSSTGKSGSDRAPRATAAIAGATATSARTANGSIAGRSMRRSCRADQRDRQKRRQDFRRRGFQFRLRRREMPARQSRASRRARPATASLVALGKNIARARPDGGPARPAAHKAAGAPHARAKSRRIPPMVIGDAGIQREQFGRRAAGAENSGRHGEKRRLRSDARRFPDRAERRHRLVVEIEAARVDQFEQRRRHEPVARQRLAQRRRHRMRGRLARRARRRAPRATIAGGFRPASARAPDRARARSPH